MNSCLIYGLMRLGKSIVSSNKTDERETELTARRSINELTSVDEMESSFNTFDRSLVE
jgi:hypothetical protein